MELCISKTDKKNLQAEIIGPIRINFHNGRKKSTSMLNKTIIARGLRDPDVYT